MVQAKHTSLHGDGAARPVEAPSLIVAVVGFLASTTLTVVTAVLLSAL